jgi:glycerate 2-kinase
MRDVPAADYEALTIAMRTLARQMFLHALGEASIEKAFERHIHCERRVLRIGDDLYDLASHARVFVVSIGKAAHTMVEALRTKVGDSLEGIVATSTLSGAQAHGFRYYEGGHPMPNADSVRAAEAILKSLRAQDQSSLVIYLLSGGGSSIVEKPYDEEISLEDVIATYRALVHSGGTIAEINAVRKHLSAVKGGRMAVAAYPAQQVSVLISDVPESNLDALASGPTMPDSTSIHDCYAIVEKYGLLGQFPLPVQEVMRRHALEETPKSDDPAFVRARWWPILSNSAVTGALAQEATRLGWEVEVDNSCDDWDYEAAAVYLLKRAREARARSGRACLISGGEVTVKVSKGGVGGRNQQFALACATKIAGENVTVLSAGTDGVDGNSPATGAIADGTTLARAHARGLDAKAALERFDAYPFFHALQDTIVTGPTGNNLRDVRIVLAY